MSWPQACITGTSSPPASCVRHGRRVVEAGLLEHRQRVHVGPQQHGRPGPVLQHGDHAGAADPGRHLVAEAAQAVGDDARGPVLGERQLGVGVQVAVERGQVQSGRSATRSPSGAASQAHHTPAAASVVSCERPAVAAAGAAPPDGAGRVGGARPADPAAGPRLRGRPADRARGQPGPDLAGAEGGGLPGHRPAGRGPAHPPRGDRARVRPAAHRLRRYRPGPRLRRPLAGAAGPARARLPLRAAAQAGAARPGGRRPGGAAAGSAGRAGAAGRGDRVAPGRSQSFDATILAWRRANAVAALQFLDAITPGARRPAARIKRQPARTDAAGSRPDRARPPRRSAARRRRRRPGSSRWPRSAAAAAPPPAARRGDRLWPCRAASAARPVGWNSTSSPPGRVTRASSRSPATGSSRWLTSPAANTASAVPPASGSTRASASSSAAPAAAAGRPAARSISGVTSTPMTVPPGPTAARSGSSARPVPQPTSRTTPPGPMPASADRGLVGGEVVAELAVPGRGPAGEEGARLGQVPRAARRPAAPPPGGSPASRRRARRPRCRPAPARSSARLRASPAGTWPAGTPRRRSAGEAGVAAVTQAGCPAVGQLLDQPRRRRAPAGSAGPSTNTQRAPSGSRAARLASISCPPRPLPRTPPPGLGGSSSGGHAPIMQTTHCAAQPDGGPRRPADCPVAARVA